MSATLPSAAELELESEASAPGVLAMGSRGINLRSEAVYVALAAAEVSWVAPLWISLAIGLPSMLWLTSISSL